MTNDDSPMNQSNDKFLSFTDDVQRKNYLTVSLLGREDDNKQRGMIYSSAVSPKERKYFLSKFETMSLSELEKLKDWIVDRKLEQENIIRRSGITPTKLRNKLEEIAKKTVRSMDIFTAQESLRRQAKKILGLDKTKHFKSYDSLPSRYGKICFEVAKYWTEEMSSEEAERKRARSLSTRQRISEKKREKAKYLFAQGGHTVKSVAKAVERSPRWVYLNVPKEHREFVPRMDSMNKRKRKDDVMDFLKKSGDNTENRKAVCLLYGISMRTLKRYIHGR